MGGSASTRPGNALRLAPYWCENAASKDASGRFHSSDRILPTASAAPCRRSIPASAVVTMSYPDGAVAIAETGSTSAITPFSIEAHGTGGSLLYSEDGIGELVQRAQNGLADSDPDPLGPDGVVRVRSLAAEPQRWTSWPLPDSQGTAFERWVRHVDAGTLDTENVELALGLSAIIEAAYRSAGTGSSVALDELETWEPAGR